MNITFDVNKNASNILKHGVSFEEVYNFDMFSAHTIIDDRRDYGEVRYVATGYLDKRLYVLCYVETDDGIRVISFRKANLRERKEYEKTFNR